MPPSSTAIMLAESPSAHNFLKSSTRSSVHMWPLSFNKSAAKAGLAGRIHSTALGALRARQMHALLDETQEDCPPHEMSYLMPQRLQYAASPTQALLVPGAECWPRFSPGFSPSGRP